MTSPTQRSLAYAEDHEWPAAVVEKWVPRGPGGPPLAAPGAPAYAGSPFGFRKDMWGCIDLLVLDDLPGVLAVQACAGSSHATRAAKARGIIFMDSDGPKKGRALRRWLEKGNRIEVWSWAKQGPRGKRKLWTLRRELIKSLDRTQDEADEVFQELVDDAVDRTVSGPGPLFCSVEDGGSLW